MPDTSLTSGTDADVVVVGAGFAGLYAQYRLRERGFSVRAFEAGSSVGGTWFWNRYPGARCDIESVDYSYSFSPEIQAEWNWSERYAAQPEILAYLDFVADRLDLREHITFNTRVISALWSEEDERWKLVTDTGEQLTTRFCVMAAGVLSSVKEPDFEGLDAFTGEVYQTSRWPEGGVDFAGKSVGVIGTGSTGVQIIPMIARTAEKLVVFQRTANFSVPARNRALEPHELDAVRATYPSRRQSARQSSAGFPEFPSPGKAMDFTPERRREVYEAAWQAGGGPRTLRAFTDIATDLDANATAADFVRGKIAEIVKDPATAERLTPKGFALGTKRICVDTDYFDTYNRESVTLVDVRATPIERFDEKTLVTTESVYSLDIVVLALGFDALTGALLEIDIRGRRGASLREKWSNGPRTYLGVAVAGFPNMFTIAGPGSPSVLGNVITSIEQHVDFIMGCLEEAARRGTAVIEAERAAEDDWVDHVAEAAEHTLINSADSWYRGSNIPGKPLVVLAYTGGVGRFRQICDEIAADDYRGFDFSGVESELTTGAAAPSRERW